ncbi:MAG: PilN domain-containing protein [Acidobacteriota bacterium]|nr:PilN domain-containing protein [Acidobacteriota bacterium]
MIRINLLTEAKAAAARKKTPVLPTGARLNNLLFIAGVAAGVLYIAAMGFYLLQKRRNLDEEIGKARIEAERLRSIIEEVKGYEAKKASLEEKIELINKLKTNQKGPVRLMDEISRALPDLVWLTSVDVTGESITMRGKTLSPNAVATYLENLKKSPFFAEPVFKNLGQDGGNQGIYSWEMNLTFHPGAGLAGASSGRPAPGPAKPAGAAPGKKT